MSNGRITLYVCAYKFLHGTNVGEDVEGFVALGKDTEGRWRSSVESESATLTGARLRQLCLDSYRDGDEAITLHLSPPLDIEFRGGSQTMTIYRALEPSEREKFLLGFGTAL